MPNRAAKHRKQERRKKNLLLTTNGRTANQITRNIERNNQRKGNGYMDLDTNIMQTITVAKIVIVLTEVERELVIPRNKEKVAEIINRHEIALSMQNSYQE